MSGKVAAPNARFLSVALVVLRGGDDDQARRTAQVRGVALALSRGAAQRDKTLADPARHVRIAGANRVKSVYRGQCFGLVEAQPRDQFVGEKRVVSLRHVAAFDDFEDGLLRRGCIEHSQRYPRAANWAIFDGAKKAAPIKLMERPESKPDATECWPLTNQRARWGNVLRQ